MTSGFSLRNSSSRAFMKLCVVGSLAVSASVLGLGSSAAWATEDPGKSAGREDAREAEVARQASSIARQTMSPFCPGRTLADCPSNYAAEWRSDIRDMVAQGFTPEQIQLELGKRAGGDLSGIPNREVGYALPLGLALAAGLVLVVLFTRLRRGSGAAEAGSAASDQTPLESQEIDEERLRAELEAEEDDER